MNIVQFIGALELGLVFGLVAIGVYLNFRIINFPDLTVDGSFSMGAAIAASMIVGGFNPWIATTTAFIGGAVAGSATAYLNVRWKIIGLLAGILTMTGLYSINLRIMGRPNLALLNESTVFSGFGNPFWVLGGLVVVFVLFTIYLLNTELGLAIRAAGINPSMSRAQGVRVRWMIAFTLMLSNGIVAFGGAVTAQLNGFADVNMGMGTIVVGAASVMIGDVIFRTRKLSLLIMSCIIGSIIYRLAVALALNVGFFGLKASDLKLITALLIVAIMIIPKIKHKS